MMYKTKTDYSLSAFSEKFDYYSTYSLLQLGGSFY